MQQSGWRLAALVTSAYPGNLLGASEYGYLYPTLRYAETAGARGAGAVRAECKDSRQIIS
jgi:hypothetical protein